MTGLGFEEFKAAIMTVPNDKAWDNWFGFIGGIKHESEGADDPELYRELAHEWSAPWKSGTADPAITDKKWDEARSDHPRARSGESLLREVGEYGWSDPRIVESFEDLTATGPGQSPIDAMNARHAVAQIALGKVVVLTFDGHGGHGFSTTNDLTQLYRYRASPARRLLFALFSGDYKLFCWNLPVEAASYVNFCPR